MPDIQIYYLVMHAINLWLQYFGNFPYLFLYCYLSFWCLGYSQYLHLLALFSRNFRYLYSSLSSSSMTRSSFLGLGTPMVLVASLCKENHWTINLTITINTSHISVHLSSKEKLQQNYNIRQYHYDTPVKLLVYGQEWFHFHIHSASHIIDYIFFHSRKIFKIKDNHFSLYL